MSIVHLPMRMLAESERPREKLLVSGRSVLSDAELLALLINTGTAKNSALDIARKLLFDCQNNLIQLGSLDISELTSYEGIGRAKAVLVSAALELGRRRGLGGGAPKVPISGSKDAFAHFFVHFEDLPHEEFWCAYLNTANRPIRTVRISQGGLNGTVADVRIILKYALECRASSLLLAHNHPSGALKPSDADLRLTRKIKEAADWMDIKVLDHIILADRSYYSFADDGSVL
jgi:DNA repair protein RadC